MAIDEKPVDVVPLEEYAPLADVEGVGDDIEYSLSDDVSGEEFVPYVPASRTMAELTVAAVVLGLCQAVFFGMADAYLGLKLGMTVGASIPAAVISMGILRGILKRGTVLENNVVQNMASVGESLAAGAAFTIPALFLLAADKTVNAGIDPGLLHSFVVACLGGLLGILFMIPLRRALIVKEHGKLRYPEGTACAEVLIAGDKGGKSAQTVFYAILVAGFYRFLMNGLDLFKEIPGAEDQSGWNLKFMDFRSALSFDLLPSLLAVGFIIGLETSSLMLAGAVLGWYVIIPCIAFIGQNLHEPLAPATKLISQMDPGDLRLAYLRYIGAGAVAFGGLVSLCKAIPTILSSFGMAAQEMFKSAEPGAATEVPRTSRDIPLSWVVGGAVAIFFLIVAILAMSLSHMDVGNVSRPLVSVVGGGLAIVFAFFFVTVSSRIVGIVGSTSMPLSGMTIGALISTCLVLKWLHLSGGAGIVIALSVGAIICIAISIGGDISQDLKIGFLVGATPRVVQTTQMASVLISAITVGLIVKTLSPLVVSHTLEAPQANLMYLLAKGILGGQLPWTLIILGMGISAVIELMNVGSLPFAIGLYLPLNLSTTVMIGGLLHHFLMKRLPAEKRKSANDHGLLVASGLVAGDAIVGVFLGLLAAGGLTLSLLSATRDGATYKHLLPFMDWGFQFYDWLPVLLFAGLGWYLWQKVMEHSREPG